MNNNKTSIKTKDLALSGILIAIVAVATRIGFNFTGTPGGYAHIGNVPLIMIAILLGKRKGAIAGGVGMALFDILSEYFAWAPFTLIIRAAMGYLVGCIAWANGKKGKSLFLNILSILVGSIVVIGGYYIAEGILYGNWVAPIQSIPGNILQLAVGLIGGLPLAMVLRSNKAISKHIEEVE